jgi:hypothetical protein
VFYKNDVQQTSRTIYNSPLGRKKGNFYAKAKAIYNMLKWNTINIISSCKTVANR